MRCRLGFDEETKLRLRADYAERGRGPIGRSIAGAAALSSPRA